MTTPVDIRSLKTPRIKYLPHLTDRVPYLHIDKGRIEQTDNGVELWMEHEGEPLHGFIPIASVALLSLGTGVSITTPALNSLATHGTTVITSSFDGLSTLSVARPLTTSSGWATAQARIHVNPELRLHAAKTLYAARLPDDIVSASTLAELRGYEGHAVKNIYATQAATFGVHNFRRQAQHANDPVNIGITYGNAILYGLAGTVTAALGLNPALGVIHEGNVRAFLYDLADVYKPATSIAAAFESSRQELPEMRRRFRELVHEQNVLQGMFALTQGILSPHVSSTSNEDYLFDPEGNVTAHTNWASR